MTQPHNAFEEIIACPASRIVCDPQPWLWPPYLPLGHLSLLVGEPGVGKSLLACQLAAWTSTGVWPVGPCGGDDPRPSRDVLMFCGEDSSHNVRQRLESAGADMDRVRLVEGVRRSDGAAPERFFLDVHGELLDELIASREYQLVVLDPLTALLSRGEPSQHGAVRRLLAPLIAATQLHGVATLAVLHMNKQPHGNGLHRVAGSVAYTAAARSVLAVVEDGVKPNRRLLMSRKSNYSEASPVLAFELQGDRLAWEPGPVDWINAPPLAPGKMRTLTQTVAWLKARLTPKGLPPGMADTRGMPPASAGAAPQVFIPPGTPDAVRRVLQSIVPPKLSLPSARDGVAVEDILAELDAERISYGTLRRAKEHLCVKAFRPPGGKGWRWMLP